MHPKKIHKTVKKTSINILCILIILLITGSVVTPMLYLGEVFFAGFQEGYTQKTALDNGEISETDIYNPSEVDLVDMYFKPDLSKLIHSTDSITFNNGKTYEMIHMRGTVIIPAENQGTNYSWIVNILYIICLVLYMLLLIQFIRFIVNINRGNIFDNKNVTRLRRFALYLISISVIKCINGLIEDNMLSTMHLHLDGYSLSTYWEMPWDTMLLGLLALLMAQVWSYGLQLKEEQSLTI